MKFKSSVLARGLVAFFGVLISFPVAAVVDDWGVEIELAIPPQRIISLAPHVTELLFALGAEDRLIAVTESCDYPAAASQLPKIANAFSVNYEALIESRPDLVIAWGTGNGLLSIDRIKQLGIPVFVSEPTTLIDVKRSILTLGELIYSRAQAGRLAEEFDKRIRQISDQYQNRQPVRLFYHISDMPLMTLSAAHYITELIELCGGVNVFSAMPQIAPVITREALYTENIDMIASVIGPLKSTLLNDQSLPVVNHRQVYSVNADLLNRPTTRLLDGAEELCRTIDQSRQYWRRHSVSSDLDREPVS